MICPPCVRTPVGRWLVLAAALMLMVPRPVEAHISRIATYTEQNGLPSSWTTDLVQGADGRMWFLTARGVAAFDGTRWETLDLSSGAPVADGFRFSFEPDGTGWAVTTGGMLYRFNGQAWNEQAAPPFESEDTLLTDFALLRAGGRFVPVTATLDRGLFLFRGGRYESIAPPGNRVYALLAVGEELLVGTDRGLWSFVQGRWTRRFLPPGGYSPAIHGVAHDTADPSSAGPEPLLLAGKDWIGRLDSAAFTVAARRLDHPGLVNYPWLLLAPDRRGGVYYGNPGGLRHLDGLSGRISALGSRRGLVGDGVLAFHRDGEANLWIATAVGVSKLGDSPFHNLGEDDGLFDSEVTALTQLPSGTLVLGHVDGLTYFDDGVQRTVVLPGEGVSRVLDLEPAPPDHVWVAAAGRGLLRASGAGGIEHVALGGRDPSNWISSVRHDAEGRLWLGGPRGILRLDGKEVLPPPPDVQGLRAVRRIVRGGDGALYFATGGHGMAIQSGEEWNVVRHPRESSANDVFTAREFQGRVLVGTRGGLFELRDGEIADLDPGGVPQVGRPVYSIQEDGTGQVWFGTDLGAYAWKPGGELRHFATQHGLAGLETSRAASFLDARGRLWLGTDRGVSVLESPARIGSGSSPRVELLRVEARGEPLDPATGKELSHDRNDLTFELRAISFVDEHRMQFRTRLAGLEEQWTLHDAPQTRLVIRYPRLPRGAYRLEAQARSILGTWGPVIRSGGFEVSLPFWRRGWFAGLLGGVFLFIALAAHSYAWQRRYSRRLEREVGDRTRELDRAHRVMEAERERLAAVLGNIADGVMALDADDRVVVINPAAERILARTPGSSTGLTVHQLIGPRDQEARAAFRTWLQETREDPARPARALTLIDADGAGPVLEFAAALDRPASGQPGVVVAFRDISQRRRVEAERERTRRIESLGVLAGGIAHDFNNILTAILGNVSLVRERASLDAASDARMQEAEAAAERAHRLARQLITFAKGGGPITASVSLEDLIRRTARLVFSGSGVHCSLRLPADIWPARAEADQIQQVFENLFINARQAMGDHGRVQVKGANIEPGDNSLPAPLAAGAYVRIDVRDHGGGIRSGVVDRIFEPYFTTKTEGSGLGLATSRSIVERHGGVIRVDTTVDRGTVFSVFLPASRERPAVAAGEPQARTAPRAARVLVLEDEPAVSDVLSDMLAALGHQVVAARDGDEAVSFCRSAAAEGRRFEAAILDLTIPGGRGGAEIVDDLRALDARLPLVASSGYSDGGVMSSFADFGFVAVLPKPYRLAAVEQVVESALRGRPPGNPEDPGVAVDVRPGS